MARRIPLDDGDRRAADSHSSVRLPRIGLGCGICVLDDHGGRDFLLLLPLIQGAGALRETGPPPHPLPGTRRRCLW